MYTTQDFLDALAHETHILKHLHGKLSSRDMEYQIGEEMRTTLELMRYLSFCAVAPTDALVHSDWSKIGPYREEASTMPAEEFPARLDSQLEKTRELVAGLSESDLQREAQLPWPATMLLGKSLVNLPQTFISTYRLQLFTHVKACGHPELSTHNAWLGIDKPEA